MKLSAYLAACSSAAAGLALVGCVAEQANVGASESAIIEAPACESRQATLFAGRTIDIGTVSVTTSESEVVLSLQTKDRWSFGLVHLYIGSDPVPTNRAGNVAPGQFPYQSSFARGTSAAELRVPLEELGASCGEPLYVAVHLEAKHPIRGSETAWAFGTPFPGRQWGWSFQYTPCCEEEEPSECVRSADYYALHPEAWTIDGYSFGGTSYTNEELLALLQSNPENDASLILAQALIGAKLNYYKPVTVCDVAMNAILRAQSWMYTCMDSDLHLPYGIALDSQCGRIALEHAAVLEAFNAGETCTPACVDAPEEEPPTEEPQPPGHECGGSRERREKLRDLIRRIFERAKSRHHR